ncbi:MAG: hypothetical protein ACLP7F_14150 [Acidimicrobiales bacterium]
MRRSQGGHRHQPQRSRAVLGAGPLLVLFVLGAGGTGPAQLSAPVASPSVAARGWGPLAYGDAQVDTPASWPVVYPGSDLCGPVGGGGVVLLGSFGTSSWCGPNVSAPVGQSSPPNLVRFGPLASPGGTPAAGHLSMTINGLRVYEGVLHGQISGTVYSVPSLGVELMASGPLAPRVIGSLAPSVREVVLRQRVTSAAPGTWRSMSFAGLRFSVPPRWPVYQTAYAFECDPPDNAFSAPAVTLDTGTNMARLPCPYPVPARHGANGVQIDEGSVAAPNPAAADGLSLVVNGLQMYLEAAYPFSSLVLDVELPGRSTPVRVTIGLGTASTAGAVLGSITALGPITAPTTG